MFDTLNNLVFTHGTTLEISVIASLMLFCALLAYLRKALTFSGACFAALLGSCILISFRFEGLVLFASFYVSCLLLEKIRGKKSKETRSWFQVVANGIMAALGALLYLYGVEGGLAMFTCSCAEASSDTWAGEIGRLSRNKPVSIMTFRPVEKGTSGGVSVLGFIGGALGSAFIVILYIVMFKASAKEGIVLFFCSFTGCVLDSILGGSVQAVYRDDEGKYSEVPLEGFALVRGIKWMDNSMVNLFSNIFAAFTAFVLARII